jgi:hypothetical protein
VANWEDFFVSEEHEDTEVVRKATKLVNVLGHLPGSREQKHEWLLRELPLLEAEADTSGLEGRALFGKLRALTIRFYRNFLRNGPVETAGHTPAERQKDEIRRHLTHKYGEPGGSRRDHPPPLRLVPGGRDSREG